MRLKVKFCFVAAVVLMAVVSVPGARRGTPAYQWTAAASLLAGRSGACAAALPDGRILITGGEGSGGPLASVEIYNVSGGVTAAPPMSSGRAGHVCVALVDGRVLVAGGNADSGSATNLAEVFDMATLSWRIVSPLLSPRAGATASLLPDGRVLVAGGESYRSALASIEIFDPGANAFRAAPQPMSSPRFRHAAAALRNGRVLLAGGSDGERALDSVDIFDPAAETTSPLGSLSVPREGLAAAALLDGRVYFAGGANHKGTLASTEIWDPAVGFYAAAPMGLARSGHTALRIPNNNAVLVVGGDEGGPPSAELYVPWTNSYRRLPSPAMGRTGAAFATLADGVVVAAGGHGGNDRAYSVAAIAAPTLATDKADYQPGQQVIISGANWKPGEVITFSITRSPTARALTLTTAADGSGGFIYSPPELVMTWADVNQTYTINATGSQGSTAEAITFTDANPQVLTVGVQNPASINPGANATYPVTVTVGGNNDSCTLTFSFTFAAPAPSGVSVTLPSTAATTGADVVQTLTLATSNITAPGSYPFTVTATRGATCQGSGNLAGSGTLAVAAPIQSTTTAVTSSVNPSVFGQSVTFTGTVTPSGSGTPTGIVTFKDGGTTLGAGTLSGGVATFSTSSLSVTAHSITAEYGGGSGYAASTSLALSQTVNKANTTTAVTSSVNPSVFGQSVNFTATISVNSPGAGTPTGSVVFSVDGTPQPAVPLSGSSATFMSSALTVSAHSISAVYSGDANFNDSTGNLTQTVNKADTTVTIGAVAPEPSVTGQSYEVNFTVTAVGPGAGTPTGNVTVTDGTASCVATIAVGKCSIASASAGVKTLSATYAGDPNFNGSTGTKAHTVNKADTTTAIGSVTPSPSVTGQSVTVSYSVIVNSPGSGTPTGNVTVSDGTFSCTGTVTAGTCVLTLNTAGAKTLTATYTGDANYNESSGTQSHTVNPAATSTAIVSSVNPSVFGQAVVFTASVAAVAPGAGTPNGGTVTFKDGVTILAGPVAVVAGAATSGPVTALGVGAHSVVAEYSGYGDYLGSNGSVAQTINKRPTSTTVLPALLSILEGGSTTVTVTVTDTADPASKSTPVGSVSLSSSSVVSFGGSCVLAQVVVGVASCSTTANGLDNGSPSIVAVYAGSAIHLASNGAAGLSIGNVAPSVQSISSSADPYAVGAPVPVTITFTDPGVLDTFTCAVTWDDNVSGPTSSVAASGASPKTCVVSRTFNSAGVYNYTATVTDKDGDSATVSSTAYVVVYDPNGGFVTGGGWITSPVGAYTANASLTGKANFGFVSKYQKGATVPAGDTEFQFHAASFNFKSVSYEWLVIAGAKAQYKGAGSVNGAGGYSFMLTAVDGAVNGGGGTDKFRLKVWNTASNAVVYDNQAGSDDLSTPTAVLGGGSIVIHSK